jgi:hypothetical protein
MKAVKGGNLGFPPSLGPDPGQWSSGRAARIDFSGGKLYTGLFVWNYGAAIFGEIKLMKITSQPLLESELWLQIKPNGLIGKDGARSMIYISPSIEPLCKPTS